MSDTQTAAFTEVADDQRLAFLPSVVGRHFMAFENAVYTIAERQVTDYQGGYWKFLQEEGGSLGYMRPAESRTWIVDTEYQAVEMSSDALGLALSIMAANQVMWSLAPDGILPCGNEQLSNLYHCLTELAYEHAESAAISLFLD
jgi:hypothetical protein